jgi:hypothetical protein
MFEIKRGKRRGIPRESIRENIKTLFLMVNIMSSLKS